MELLRGTLDMLILKVLEGESLHGYDIARRIESGTRDVLRVEEGSLYPALHRLEERGRVASRWGRSDNKRRAKFYRLTGAGREQLRTEARDWERYARAVGLFMNEA